MEQDNYQHIEANKELIENLIEQGINDANTIVQIRYVELAIHLALISERIKAIVEPAILKVFEKFFSMDPLTQINTMDFVNLLDKKPWTSQILTKS